jgi:uncharacterized membrane protein YdjX (TVP38/TMEM64 family)
VSTIKEKFKKFFSGRNIYSVISALIVLGIIILGSVLLGPKITEIARDPESFRELLGKGFKSYLIFICIQFVQVIFAFIPGEFIELGAGYIYGGVKGTLLCIIGVFFATVVIFGLTRLLGKKFTDIMIDKRDLKRLKFLQNEKKLELIFFLLYFIPGTPKDLFTYFAGVTKIKFGTFLFISTVCRLPSVVTSTAAGAALGSEKYLMSALIFAITGMFAIGGFLLYRFLSRKKEKSK